MLQHGCCLDRSPKSGRHFLQPLESHLIKVMISLGSLGNDIISKFYITTYNTVAPVVEATKPPHVPFISRLLYFGRAYVTGFCPASYGWTAVYATSPRHMIFKTLPCRLQPPLLCYDPVNCVFQLTFYKVGTGFLPESPPGEEPSQPHWLDHSLLC